MHFSFSSVLQSDVNIVSHGQWEKSTYEIINPSLNGSTIIEWEERKQYTGTPESMT